jgi:23S rRNA pseudouridine2605 synthase
MPLERLQKILAAAGVASRRKSEELITSGRVEVNGEIVAELGAKADPATDRIRVDGKPLRLPEQKRVLMLNKPKGYVSTTADPEHRPTVLDLMKDAKSQRLYPIGRLDYHSEGLLLLTNDGDLAEQLTRASSHVPKLYLVKISGKPEQAALNRLRHGVKLPPRPIYDSAGKIIPGKSEPGVTTAPARIELFKDAPNPWFEVTLIQGRNRQIRRMFEEIGHHVEKIKRVRYGPLELNVHPGEYRELSKDEVERLRHAVRGRSMPTVTGEQAREAAETSSRRTGARVTAGRAGGPHGREQWRGTEGKRVQQGKQGNRKRRA